MNSIDNHIEIDIYSSYRFFILHSVQWFYVLQWYQHLHRPFLSFWIILYPVSFCKQECPIYVWLLMYTNGVYRRPHPWIYTCLYRPTQTRLGTLHCSYRNGITTRNLIKYFLNNTISLHFAISSKYWKTILDDMLIWSTNYINFNH